MTNYNEINTLFCENNKAKIILELEESHLEDGERVKWLEINSKGKITNTGENIKIVEYDNFGKKKIRYEKGDTFNETYINLKTIKVGEYPKISFNKKNFIELSYVVNNIKASQKRFKS